MGRKDIRTFRWRAVVLAGLAAMVLLSGCAGGGGGDRVSFDATVNGVDIATTDPNDPVELIEDDEVELDLEITNTTDEPLTVRYVRFEGAVLDLTFLSYDTSVRVDLEPGQTVDVPPIVIDMFDLGGQASGYLRGLVELYDADRELLRSEVVFLDANGDGLSTMELFNWLLVLAALAGAGWNLLRLSQRRLPANGAVRAVRFLALGIVVGLAVAVACSTLRIWPLSTVAWVIVALVGAVAGYGIGLILPGGDVLDDDDDVIDALSSSPGDGSPESVVVT